MKYFGTAVIIAGIVLSTFLMMLEPVVGSIALTVFTIVSMLFVSCMKEK
jgi:cell division protein FtsW (lipid II flippase)